MMTQRYDVALDLFATDGINEALKKMGTEFSLTIAPRNVVVKPKNCCACTAFDWPLEKIKEIKLVVEEYAQPALYVSATTVNGLVPCKFYFHGLESAASEAYNLIDSNIEAMGSIMSASPAWTPFIGKAMSFPTPFVPMAVPAPEPVAPPAEGEEVEVPEAEPVDAAPHSWIGNKLVYQVSLDEFATVTDPEGLDKLGPHLTLIVHPRELEFKSNKMFGGSLHYKIEQVKVVQVLSAEYCEPSLLICTGRGETEVSHKLWFKGGGEPIEECKNGILSRIEAMCAELGSAPAWYRLAPAADAKAKKSIFRR